MLLNKRNKNGSINFLQVTGEDIGAIFSPLHPEFRSQIEDGIWPIVSKLVNSGFYVVDSCQGHWDNNNDDYCHFTIAFTKVESAVKFSQLVYVKGIDFTIHDSCINVDNEIDFINKLYLTTHDNFVFLSIKILPNKSKLIKMLFTNLIRWCILKKLERVNYEHIN